MSLRSIGHADAQLVTQGMIEELEKRIPYRRVMKQAIDRVQKAAPRREGQGWRPFEWSGDCKTGNASFG